MRRERRLASTTWILALAAICLAAVTYIAEVRGGREKERSHEATTSLLQFTAGSASQLVIERANERIDCRKVGDRWRIVAPIAAVAADTTITRLLEDVEKAKIERTLDGWTSDLAAYGLAHPTILTVVSGTKRQSLRVGKATPTDDFVFVQKAQAGAPVQIAAKSLRQDADETLFNLRDKNLFAFIPERIKAVTFENRGRRVRLIRVPATDQSPEAGWRVQEPVSVRADRGLVERALDSVTGLRAEAYASETQANRGRFGLDAPWARVRFILEDGRADELLLGKKTTEGALTRWYACRPGTGPIFTINDNLSGEVKKNVSDWRERHLADFERNDVAELRLIQPAYTVVCAQAESEKTKEREWRLAQFSGPVAEGMSLGAAAKMPTAVRADPDRVSDLIGRLATLQAVAFVDTAKKTDSSVGLARPWLKVVALSANNKVIASVSLGSKKGTECFANSPHLDGAVRVPLSDANRFKVQYEDLAARK